LSKPAPEPSSGPRRPSARRTPRRSLPARLIARVPAAQVQPHARLVGSPFVQEDCGPELARRVVELVRTTG